MNELICPNCKKAFQVDEAGFANIIKQVRDHQFEEEIQKRLYLAEKEKKEAIKLAEANIKNSLIENLYEKREGAKLSFRDIFKKHGKEYFRKLEKEVFGDAISGKRRIVSLGGGTLGELFIYLAGKLVSLLFWRRPFEVFQ